MWRADNTILLIDDNPDHAAACRGALTIGSDKVWQFDWVRSLAAGLEWLSQHDVWAVFLNLTLPDGTGIEALDRLIAVNSSTAVVVLAGIDDDELCKTAMHHGARDYLLEGHLDSYAFSRALRNIHEREVARHELFDEKERAQVTLNSIGDAVLSTDILGNVTYLNVVAEHMTGWTCQEALGRPVAEVFNIVDSLTHMPSRNPLELAIQRDEAVGLSANCILIRRDGAQAAIEDSSAPIHDRDGRITGAVIVFRDVIMARAMVLEMSHQAQHDPLTDLPNRLLLKDRLTQSILLARRNESHLAVLFVDLDGFKHINDSLGHAAGDAVLQSIAARLTASARRSDTVSRQGGDEFVILLPAITHASDAAISAAKIIAELRKPLQIGEHRLQISASIGISTYPGNGDTAEALIKNADTAMYHAKQRGRANFQFFSPDMHARAAERHTMEGQLRAALESEELVLHYQPKVSLRTGQITSVEALVRWQHPDRGLLLPGQFLTVAEENGLIVAIDRWVLREACRQTRAWLDAGVKAVPVAVNISSLEFRSDQFLDGLQMALQETRLDPRYLELELTETVLMRQAELSTHTLETLKHMGVRLAVDDFGTGYSSLSYLTRFPVDALKIDQSFVHDVVGSADDAIVVSAVISMARNLKHRVIAEGVETSEQLAFLTAQGCDEGQGFFFSRPVGAEQFASLLKTGLPKAAWKTAG